MGLIDTRTSRGIGAVRQLPRVHGIALVPELSLAFTSNGEDNTIGSSISLTTGSYEKPRGDRIRTPSFYDARPRLIYVADYDGKTATLLDPPSSGMVAILALGGKPEHCQADPESGLVYQDLQAPVR